MAELEQGKSGVPQREREAVAGKTLNDSIKQLLDMKLGGFKLIETTIPGADNLNPERKAKKTIFLTDEERQRDRDELKKRLELWKDLLSGEDVAQMSAQVEEKYKEAEQVYKANLKVAVEETRELEAAYQGVAMFFANAETSGTKIRNVAFLNAAIEQLNPADVYNNDTIEYVKNELNRVYNRFDLTDSYSLMVIPGYLGSRRTVDTWAKIASDHKLTLVTDYRNMESIKDIITEFGREKLASDGDRYANILMACNYLVGRGKYEELGEEEDLYLPPSSALAGKLHMNLISQVSAGERYGTFEQSDGVRLDLLKTEVGELEGLGLIPINKDFGKSIAWSGKTLYNGTNVGLKTYSVVRVFDWIMKVLMHYLNKRAQENWSSKIEYELTEEIIKFLDRIKGPGKIIEKFEVPKFRPDPAQPDRIFLDINITPFFPAKTFIIGMTGEKGRDDNTGRRGGFEGGVKQK